MTPQITLRFTYLWRRFMHRCRQAFNPVASRRYSLASAARVMRMRHKGKSPASKPIEIIGRPSAAFTDNYMIAIKNAIDASIATENVLQDLEAMQAFFEDNIEYTPSAYKARNSIDSLDVVYPQIGLADTISGFISDCIVGRDIKTSVMNVATSADLASQNLDVITAAIVENSNDISELALSLKQILNTNPIDFLTKKTGATLTATIGDITSAFPAISFLAFLGTFLYYVARPSKSTLLIMSFTLAAAIYYNWSAVSDFLVIAKKFIPSFGMVPQAGVDFDGLLYSVTLLLFGLNVRNSNMTTLPKQIIEHLKSFKTIKDSLKDIVSFVMSLVSYVLDFASLSEVLPVWTKFLNITDPEVKNLFVSIDNVNQSYVNNRFPLNKTNAALLQTLQKQVIGFLRTLPVNQTTTAIRDSLKSELPKLNKLLEVFRSAKLTDDGKRIEPVFALFAGAPGNFKSQMVELLCASLQYKTLDPERFAEAKADHFRYVFKREQSNVYWDGFKDPHIVIFDDIGQFKTCVQNIDNEFADVLKGVNELPLPLHMANVDNKGNTYFKARFIIGTTNFTSPSMDNINSKEAYNRRVAFAFYQVPRAEFCTADTLNLDPMSRKLDKTNPNLPRGPQGCILTHPKYHSEFLRYNPHNPSEILGTFDYDQVVDMLVADYYQREKFFTQKAVEVDEIYDFNPYVQEEIDEIWMDKPSYTDSESGESNYLEPQMGIEDVDSFDDFVSQLNCKVDHVVDTLCVDDDTVTRAYKLLSGSNIKLKRKIAFIKFEHAKLFGQQLEGSDEFIFLKTSLATREDSLMPYFSNKVPIHVFREAFLKRKDIYVVGMPDALVFSTAFEQIDSQSLQNVWITSLKNFRDTVYTTASSGFEIVSNWYKSNSFWLNPILAVIATAITVKAGSSFVKYVSSSGDELTEEDMSFENEATEEFIVTNPVEPTPPTPKKNEAPQSLFYDRGSGKGRLGKARFRKNKNGGNDADEHYERWVSERFGPEMALDADPAAYDLATRINGSCLLTLTYETNKIVTRMGHALVVADRVCVVPKHFYVMMKASFDKGSIPAEANIRISFRSTLMTNAISTYVTIEDFLDTTKWIFTEKLTALDEALFILPADSARKYKSIVDRIATIEMHKENTVRSGFLMGYDEAQNNLATFKFEPIVGQTVYDPLTGAYTICDAYSYYANTGKGDCGTPLYVHCRTQAKAKIFGMHVAGTSATGRGVGSILVREYIEDAMSLVPQCCKITTNSNDFELSTNMSFAQNQFIDAHESLARVSEPGKSKIEKSELYGEWGPATTKAAYLRECTVNGEVVQVKEKAYSKVCIGKWNLSEKVVKDVEDTYFSDMMEVSRFDVEKRIYSFEEAVCGLKDDPNFGAIARNTSPGFPFILDPKVKRSGPGKRYWFGIESEYDIDNPRAKQLKKECEDIIVNAKKGVRSEHIFVDCLKDERRPIEKADAGKTRMINSGPMRLLIIMRMYFGAFSNWFTQNRVLNGSAIGVNPYSNEWDEVARNLKKFGTSIPNVGAGDYSGYDGSEKPIVHNAILNIINRWYDDGEENALIRTVLWAEVVQSKHISGNIIYTWPMSLPSGHPLTALINTIYNGLAFRYCWFRACGNDRKRLSDFLKNIYTIMLGDDNVYTVHPEMVDSFNDINLEKWMAEFGLVYTNETKTGTMSELRNLEEVAFLKRTFRYEPILGRYVAPLSLPVILEIPYWTKKKDGTKITEDNATFSISELALHGEKTYEKWAPKIAYACKQRMDYNVRVDSFPLALENVTNFEWNM